MSKNNNKPVEHVHYNAEQADVTGCTVIEEVPSAHMFPAKAMKLDKDISKQKSIPILMPPAKGHTKCSKFVHEERARANAAVAEAEKMHNEMTKYRDSCLAMSEETQTFMHKQQRTLAKVSKDLAAKTIENKSLKAQLSDMRKRVTTLEKEKGSRQELKNADLEEKIDDLKEAVKDAKKELKEKVKEAKDKCSEDMKQKEAIYKLSLETHKAASSHKDDVIKKNEGDIKQYKSSIKALESKLEKEQTNNKKLTDENIKLKTDGSTKRQRKNDISVEEQIVLDREKSSNRIVEHFTKSQMNSMASPWFWRRYDWAAVEFIPPTNATGIQPNGDEYEQQHAQQWYGDA